MSEIVIFVFFISWMEVISPTIHANIGMVVLLRYIVYLYSISKYHFNLYKENEYIS